MNYKTCNDCIHACVCKYKDEKVSLGTTVGEILHDCKNFKSNKDFKSHKDFAEVVRCNDCKFFYVNNDFPGGRCELTNRYYGGLMYCAHGERKEDDDNGSEKESEKS